MSRQGKGTPLPMQRYNNKLRAERIKRLISDNFTDKDYFIILHYGIVHRLDEETAKRIFSEYIKQLRDVYRASGKDIKYIKATRRGKRSGITHYLILGSGADKKYISWLWEYSNEPPRVKKLSELKQAKLIKPLLPSDEFRFRLNERGYTTSRNLKR